MVTVSEILQFLKTENLQPIWRGSSAQLESCVKGVTSDQCARDGDLAWISPKTIKSQPERLSSFKGSLLIVPHFVENRDVNQPFIACKWPKLAFIKVVNAFFGDKSRIVWPPQGNTIGDGSEIDSSAVLAKGVVIGPNVVIGKNVEIGPNTVIANCIIHGNVRIGANCSIGLPGFGYEKDENGQYWRFPHLGNVIIEQDVEIGSNTCVDRGALGSTIIRQGAKIDNLVHVAHNVEIGRNSLVIANTMIGGSVHIGDDVWCAPSVSLMNQIHVGNSSVLGMGSVILKDVEDHSVMVGNPARLLRKREGAR